MDIKLRYNYPPAPTEGIEMNVIYTLGKDDKGYFLESLDKKLKVYRDINRIKRSFDVVSGKEDFDNLFIEKREQKFTTKKKKTRKEGD